MTETNTEDWFELMIDYPLDADQTIKAGHTRRLDELRLSLHTKRVLAKNGTIRLFKKIVDENGEEVKPEEPELQSGEIIDDEVIPEPEEEPVIELDLVVPSDDEPTQEELDMLWISSQVAGTRSRYCGECGEVHSGKLDLYNCDHTSDE